MFAEVGGKVGTERKGLVEIISSFFELATVTGGACGMDEDIRKMMARRSRP